MKKVLIILLLVSMLLLTGCKSVNYGTVMEKSFTPAFRSHQPYVMIINGRTMIFSRQVYHPDKWSILVENEDGRDWWNVSEEYYNSVNVGDSVDRRK